MTAHIIVPALDTERCATLSRKTLAYLRETLGFKGVIVSDSLVMEGVLKTCRSIDEAAIQALMAGCDLLILGGKLLSGERSGFELQLADIQQVHRAIVDGVKTGRIPEDRIDEAAQKILDLKRRYLLDCQMQLPLECAVDLAEHQVLAETVATLAIKAGHRGEEWIGPLQEKKVIVFAPAMLKETMEQTSLLKIGKTTQLRLFSPFDPTDFDLRDLKESVLSADLLVVCSYNAWKNRAQARWIQSCLDTGKPTILIALRDPLDASLFPAAQWIFQTFSPAPCSIDAVCKQLIQR
jgi:beta-N-acetylhexosaminidase